MVPPGGGGGAVTVIAPVPDFASLVAVIVAEPTVTPVTTPLPFTVATPLLLLAQVTVRPANALPAASLGDAASCTVPPTSTPADAGVTTTDATGVLATTIAAVPLRPSLVAVIVTEPVATARTRPLELTVEIGRASCRERV